MTGFTVTDEAIQTAAKAIGCTKSHDGLYGEEGCMTHFNGEFGSCYEASLWKASRALGAAARTAQPPPTPASELIAVCEALTEQGLTDECGFDDRWRERVATQVLTFLSVARPQLTATREKLTKALEDLLWREFWDAETPYAEAADDGVLRVLRKTAADITAVLLASGVVQEARSEAEVRADALEVEARRTYTEGGHDYPFAASEIAAFLNARAAAIRAGGQA